MLINQAVSQPEKAMTWPDGKGGLKETAVGQNNRVFTWSVKKLLIKILVIHWSVVINWFESFPLFKNSTPNLSSRPSVTVYRLDKTVFSLTHFFPRSTFEVSVH